MNSFFDKIKFHSEYNPDKCAITDGQKNISYRMLYKFLLKSRNILKKIYKPKTTIIVRINNQLNFSLAILSLFSNECFVIPLSEENKEYKEIQRETNAFIYDADLIEKIMTSDEDFEDDLDEVDDSSFGIYHYTSGTTDKAKLCVRTLRKLVYEGESYKQVYSICENDRILSTTPLYHSYAMGAALMASLVSGITLFTINRFMPRKVLDIIKENNISILVLAPVTAKALTTVYTKTSYNLYSLRIAIVGAGPISSELFTDFKTRFGIPLSSNYGSTETGGLISRISNDLYTSIGKPMPGVKVIIRDEGGKRCANGMVGNLFVNSKSMMTGYYHQSVTLAEDEYFDMGDLAWCDVDGNIYLAGRVKDIINVGGKKVNPQKVEKVILEFEGINDCIVYGNTREGGEEFVCALVVMKYDIDIRDIIKFCSERLETYEVPYYIRNVQIIPRNELGKLNKKLLASKF